MAQTLYSCRSLQFHYQEDGQSIPVLHDLSLDIPVGECVCLTGPSGSGKSTLLHLLGLIDHPQEGQLHFLGEDVKVLSEAQLNHHRRFHIGVIFQDFQLSDVLSVTENVAFFLTRQGLSESEVNARVQTALEDVGLWDHRQKRPGQLSGGQRQRVAIARALAKHPQVIVADEPTASLDHKTGRVIMEQLRKICETRGVSIILASHDPMVLEYCAREIRLQDGRVMSDRRSSDAR